MARFALQLGLKRDPGLGQELLWEREGFSLGENRHLRYLYIFLCILRMGDSRSGSSSPIVTMMQPAEPILRKDAPRGCGANSVVGSSLLQPKMRSVFVIVADVFREQTFQMAFIHRNHVIQQISSAACNPTLRYAILPRAFERRSCRAHLQGSNRRWNLQPVLRIAVEDEKARGQLKRKRFSQLLHDPHASRMLGDVNLQDASPIMMMTKKQ